MDFDRTELPGVGTRATVALSDGCRVAVIAYGDGMRDLALFRVGEDEPFQTLRMDEGTACALGALLCAALRTEE